MTLALPTSVKEAVALKNERRIFGPPGTGKTTYLAKLIGEYIESKKYRPSEIVVTSFTRGAAAEVASRGTGIPKENIQTLHALGFRLLKDTTELAESHVDEWNAWLATQPHVNARKFALSRQASGDGNESSGKVKRSSLSGADSIFAEYTTLRAQLALKDALAAGSSNLSKFHALWSDWKRETGYIDFQDMIELPFERQIALPSNVKVLICDEFQDFTAAEARLARFWGRAMQEFILAGDDDQCSPGYTQVLTPEGYVSMEALDPEKHRVISYDRAGAAVTGLHAGYAFQKASRPFDGTLYHISADGKTTDCTPNHRFIAKWSREACEKTHVVYLMRKGDRYRIGWCKLFNVENGFHLGARARLEEADAAWILHVTDNRTDASVMESVLSSVFGIPTVTFRECHNSNHYTREAIDRIFILVKQEVDLRPRAVNCLRHCGRDIDYPIWTQQKAWERRGGTSIIEIEAVNMISDLMLIPSHKGGSKAEWCPITITKEQWSGMVYSLDVEKYHLYISDGLVTHNCLYFFKGASSDNFIYPTLPAEQMHILSQSYRVPRQVQEYAEQWIKFVQHRQAKAYHPRREVLPDDTLGEIIDGKIIYRPGAQAGSDFTSNTTYSWQDPELYLRGAIADYLSQGKEVMFLASCAYMLNPLKELLRTRGIPFHNPYRTSRVDWNPLGRSTNGVSSINRLLAFLRPSSNVWGEHEARMWTIEDFILWTEALQKKDVLRYHGKTPAAIKRYHEELADNDPEALSQSLDLIEHLSEWLTDEALQNALDQNLDWFESKLTSDKRDALQYPLHVAKTHGGKTLFETPNVIIGTIHSVKGGSADVVYLFPDISMEAEEETKTREGRDALVRLFYVGMTRAKETLVLCAPAGKNFAKFPRP